MRNHQAAAMSTQLSESELLTFLELRIRAESTALEILTFARSAWVDKPDRADILRECERTYEAATKERQRIEELLRHLRSDGELSEGS